jgi:serine/threonine protein kinase
MELADPAESETAANRAGDDIALTAERPRTAGFDAAAYVPRTLRWLVQNHGRLPFVECVEIGLRLAAALEHLHQQGLVHRDIKPSNVIFVNGKPKLADIGLVTAAGEHRSLVGTEGFLAPEGAGTPRADVFSLGKLLYELATGKDSRSDPEPVTVLARSPERDRLRELNEVLLRACEPDPAKRNPNAAALRRDLLLVQAGDSPAGGARSSRVCGGPPDWESPRQSAAPRSLPGAKRATAASHRTEVQRIPADGDREQARHRSWRR